MLKRVYNLNRIIKIGLACYFVVSLLITVQDAIITKASLQHEPVARWQYWNLFSLFIIMLILQTAVAIKMTFAVIKT